MALVSAGCYCLAYIF